MFLLGRKLTRLINLFVSVTDEKCFHKCNGKDKECKRKMCGHVEDESQIEVKVDCMTCSRDLMTGHYWNKSRDISKFDNYVEKNTKSRMHKFAVPPGVYSITCRKLGKDADMYLEPVPQKRLGLNYLY